MSCSVGYRLSVCFIYSSLDVDIRQLGRLICIKEFDESQINPFFHV